MNKNNRYEKSIENAQENSSIGLRIRQLDKTRNIKINESI